MVRSPPKRATKSYWADRRIDVAEQATEHMLVDASPEKCFEVVSNVESYPEWAEDIKHVEVKSRDGDGRPADATFRAGAFGRSSSYTLRYDYSRAPQVLAWKQTEGDMTTKLDGQYAFKAASGGGTDVTYTLEVELRVPLPGFIKRRAHSRVMHTALEELRSRVESTPTK